MIDVCKRCLPKGWPVVAPEAANPWAWALAPDTGTSTCDVCGFEYPRDTLARVDATAQDLRFETWRRTFCNGTEEER